MPTDDDQIDATNDRGGQEGKDRLLIEALAERRSKRDAAAIGGVSERTLYRRLEDPTFVAAVEARAAEIAASRLADYRAVHDRRLRLAQRVDDALEKMLDDESAVVRLAAAKQLQQGLQATAQNVTMLTAVDMDREPLQFEPGRGRTAWPG